MCLLYRGGAYLDSYKVFILAIARSGTLFIWYLYNYKLGRYLNRITLRQLLLRQLRLL